MILNLVQLATAMIIHFSRILPCTALSLHSDSVSVALVTLGINNWMERWVLPHCVTLISSTLIERFVSMEMLTKNHFNWLEVVDAFVSIVCFFSLVFISDSLLLRSFFFVSFCYWKCKFGVSFRMKCDRKWMTMLMAQNNFDGNVQLRSHASFFVCASFSHAGPFDKNSECIISKA